MGRFRDAWKALWSGDAPKESAAGLLAGIFPSGQAARRGTRELLIAYRQSPWLRAVCHRIGSEVASVPWRVLAPTRKTSKGIYRQIHRANRVHARRHALVTRGLDSGELAEVDGHPFLDLLERMNPALGGEASHHVTQVHLDLKGESFWIWERNALGEPLEAWPVPPHWIAETPSANSPYFRASYLGWQRSFPETDVLWLRSPDPEMPYGRGTGIGEALADEIDVDELARKHLKDWFAGGGLPSAIVTMEGIGEPEARRWQTKFQENYSGPGRKNRVHVAGKKLDIQTLSHTFAEQEMGTLRANERDIILQVFGVPPEIMGIVENSNRSTIDAAAFLFASGVICPRLDFKRSALQAVLASYGDPGLVLDYVSPVPEDREFEDKVMSTRPNAFTVNEHRALAGHGPQDGGDVPFAPAVSNPFASIGLGAEPAWVKQLHARASVVKEEPPDVDNILEALRPERLTFETGPLWEEKVRAWGEKVIGELGAGSFDMRNPLVRDVLEQSGTRITEVSDTTRDALRVTLNEGVHAGEGIGQLKRRVEDTFADAQGYRAEMIARTEVVGSSNAANLAAFELSGIVEGKEWLSVRDGKARPDHADLDGQIVGISDPFVGASGVTAMAPGQSGVAAFDINCRCSVLPVVDMPEKAHRHLGAHDKAQLTAEEKDAAWKAFDQALIPWERAAVEALRRGFAKQRADVLAALGG